ncbi:unnamed protein product, partial [Ectocarpus sp. 4 AP-2014]
PEVTPSRCLWLSAMKGRYLPLEEPLHDQKTLGDLRFSDMKVLYAYALSKAEVTVDGPLTNNSTGTSRKEQVAAKLQDLFYGSMINDDDKRLSLREDLLDRIRVFFETRVLPSIGGASEEKDEGSRDEAQDAPRLGDGGYFFNGDTVRWTKGLKLHAGQEVGYCDTRHVAGTPQSYFRSRVVRILPEQED